MEGFEDFLENEAGQDLPDLNVVNTDTDTNAAGVAVGENEQNANNSQTQQQGNDQPGAAQPGTEGGNTNVDNNVNFEDISGGTIKTKEEFTTVLERANRADALQKQVDEWMAKYGENPYADSFEETRNQLKKSGATEVQLKELEEITKLGELSELSPLEIKVKAMVLRDNVRPEIAERIIKEEYKLTDFLNDEDKEVAETRLALGSKEDLKYLQDYKSKLQPIDNSTVQLQRDAAVTQAKQALVPIADQFKKEFAEIKDFNITGATKPEDVQNFTFKTPQAFTDAIPALIEGYIIQNGKPVNEDTIKEAQQYVENLQWAMHGKEFLRAAVNHAISTTTEKLVDKYENRQTNNDDHNDRGVVNDDMDEFFASVAR